MKLLAFDTSTETMSIAVARGDRVWRHEGLGGAQASARLIPAILGLLGEAGLTVDALDALVFGRGPGSFTGLRTACSVAQGLALGAEVQGRAFLPVLPVDTLLAVADEARHQTGAHQVLALLDARMDEIYAASYDFDQAQTLYGVPPVLIKPEAVLCPRGWVMAGNVAKPYAGRLPAGTAPIELLPGAPALLRLAPGMLAAGLAVSADQALPLYIRDKVASTTAERALAKAQLGHNVVSAT